MNPTQGRKNKTAGCSPKDGETARVLSVIKKMIT